MQSREKKRHFTTQTPANAKRTKYWQVELIQIHSNCRNMGGNKKKLERQYEFQGTNRIPLSGWSCSAA